MDPATFLAPTEFVDSAHERVVRLARRIVGSARGPAEGASRLFRAVRDDYRYDPYQIDLSRPEYRASRLIERSHLFCVPKAIVFVALSRAAGIPAALGFADVRNHLATPRLLRWLRSGLFVFHGYAALFIEGRWLKASPTFNRELCEFLGVPALEFDGRRDALLQACDGSGRRHMEYVTDRGLHADLPFDGMRRAWAAAYPHLFGASRELAVRPEHEP